MIKRRRLPIVVSLPLVLLVGLAATQVAALAQAFKQAGNYNNTSMLGSVFYNDPQTSVFVFANRQITVGPSGLTDQTSIFLNLSANFGALNVNCFLNDSSSDFNVSPDVSSAALHKRISRADPACGGSLLSDLQLDVTWAGAGPVQLTRTSNRFSCSGYKDETQGNDSNNAGIATFDITGLDAPITTPNPQTFHLGSSLEHVQGALPPSGCSTDSLGRGAGRVTPTAGNYDRTLQEASTFDFSNGFFMLNVDRTLDSSNPVVGPSSSTAQTAVTLSADGVSGCFLINPNDFTVSKDMSTAALHTSLTGSTPACGGGTNVVNPDPFQIDAIWTGTAPVSDTGTDTQFACNTYHFQTNFKQQIDQVADLTVSMPNLALVLPGTSHIGANETRTHADGTPAPGCFFRG